MNIGVYQSAAALSSLEKWQDAVSQNITSSQVTGYRKRVVEMGAQTGGSWQIGTAGGSDTTVTSVFPSATGGINYQAGDTEHTGRDLDVAIQGEGFFELQMPDGSRAYTRNGEFSTRSDHTLIAGNGAQVLNAGGSPITLLPGGGNVTFNQDGTIVQGDTALGRISVQKFANEQDLEPAAGGLFVPTNDAQPEPVTHPDLLQGYREASNVNPMREMVDMVLITRSYEANQKVITNADEQTQKALDALG